MLSSCLVSCNVGVLLYDDLHGSLKLLELDLTISIPIDFLHDVVPDLFTLGRGEPTTEDLLELFLGDRIASIFVYH